MEGMTSQYLPRRIACLQPSATVILDSLGELGRVVACTRYCADVVPEAADGSRMILADSWTADTEQIVAARPDLVIAAVPYQEKAVSEILKSGSRFLGLAPRCLANIYTDIATIAGIVGAAGRGDEIISSMQRRVEGVRARTCNAPRPKVFCEEWGKPIIASQVWVAELVETAGGKFVGNPGKQVAPVEIERTNPDVVVTAWCGAGDRVPLEKIVRERRWLDTSAARNGRVFCIRDEFLNTPAPTLLRGLDALAFAIHPELFPATEGIRRITDVAFPQPQTQVR
jgi:iron complex transport system substrate-binding protein